MPRISILFTLLIIFSASFANEGINQLNQNSYSLGAGFGSSRITDLGNSIKFPLGHSTFIYDNQQNNQYPLLYNLSFYKIFKLTSLYTLQAGLNYQHLANMTVQGDLQQGISPPYYQARYVYSVHSSQLLAEVKLLHQWHDFFYPYLTVGLGEAFNKAENYSTDVPEYLTVTPDYNNKTTRSFSYDLGLGIDFFIAPKCSVGLGYRFSDLGSVGLGDGKIRSTEVPDNLRQPHLYANTLLVQLQYFL